MKKLFQSLLTLLGVSLAATTSAHAFSWEDPVKSSEWHHQNITKDATKDHFSPAAAEAVAWHSDYVDSYLYNPLWWASGGLGRFKASMATSPELEKLHFDDLFDADKVRYMWRRYASGTMAGLLWAKEKNDVAAAQNIVGVSLHAVQDFYSHSNWVDDAARRQKTLFNIPIPERGALPLYTGAYEHDEHHGVKHHGKFVYECSIMNQPGVKQLLSVACGPGSPLGNSDMCRTFDACKNGTPVRFEVHGVKIPSGVIYQAPPGIALDSKWLSQIGVKQRGLTDIDGDAAFAVARALAVEASKQWLKTLEENMGKAGGAAFWNRVKTEGSTPANRERQFENYNQFPYTFISAGPYPPKALTPEEIYLRVRLKTANTSGAGTDSDIYLKADNQDIKNGDEDKTLLDYMPRANPVLAYNDFEAGDDNSYVAGPFNSLPGSIQLYNHSATTGEVLKALGNTLLTAVTAPFKSIGSMFTTILGSQADWIGTRHHVWKPEQLATVPTAAQAPGISITVLGRTITGPPGQPFTLDVNGGDKGHYKVTGRIVKVAESAADEPQGWRDFQVHLIGLECVKESKWDRGSNSDEPFVLALLTPLPGDTQKHRSQPFDDVDSGETRSLNYAFQTVRVPKDFGMLNVAVSVMESDDESIETRNKLLDTFAGEVEKESATAKRGLVSAMGAAIAEDWKLEHIEVYAWSRGGQVRSGKVLDVVANRWIKGRQTASFNLNPGGLKDSGVHTDDLLPYIAPQEQPTEEPQPGTETPPPGEEPPPGQDPVPGTGEPLPGNQTPGGEPAPQGGNGNGTGNGTGTGTGTTGGQTNSGGGLGGTFGGLGSIGGGFKQLDDYEVKVDSVKVTREDTLDVLATYKNIRKERAGLMPSAVNLFITDADGVGYNHRGNIYETEGEIAKVVTQTIWLQPGEQAQVRYQFTIPRGAVPLKRLTFRQTNEKMQHFDVSSVSLPAPVPPGITVSGVVGGAGYNEFGPYDVKLNGVRKGRNNTLQAFFTFKNMEKEPKGFYAGDMTLNVSLSDGNLKRSNGNIYRGSGEGEGEMIPHTIIVAPQEEALVRFIFQLPAGTTAQKLSIKTHGNIQHEYSLPQLP